MILVSISFWKRVYMRLQAGLRNLNLGLAIVIVIAFEDFTNCIFSD